MTHIFRNQAQVLNLLGFNNLSHTASLLFGVIYPNGEIKGLEIDRKLKDNILAFLKQSNSKESKY